MTTDLNPISALISLIPDVITNSLKDWNSKNYFISKKHTPFFERSYLLNTCVTCSFNNDILDCVQSSMSLDDNFIVGSICSDSILNAVFHVSSISCVNYFLEIRLSESISYARKVSLHLDY